MTREEPASPLEDPTIGIMETPPWCDELFGSLKLNADGSAEEIFGKTDNVATRLAPNTRMMWGVILAFQGVAVLVPLFWLLIIRNRWDVSYTASGVVFCTLLVVGILWWVRWRGMQHTWVRSRMVAEIARSLKVTQKTAPGATVEALVSSPALQSIARRMASECSDPQPLEMRLAEYRNDRIVNQLDHYRGKFFEAMKERRNLSRTVTLCLDAALFLAVLGLAISLRDQADRWLAWSGSDYMLGFIGAALPLLALLAQLKGSYLQLNRRIGRYSQQVEFLEAAKMRSDELQSESAFHDLVADVESTLLGEVVDWFYQAEGSELFYRSKPSGKRRHAGVSAKPRGIVDRLLGALGLSVGFVGRVLIGRVLVVALSVVFTTALIHFKQAPKNPTTFAKLSSLEGRLLMPAKDDLPSHPKSYQDWDPNLTDSKKGLILIAHGLTDGVEDPTKDAEHWMTRMQQSITRQLGDNRPGICLVDWHDAAKPGEDMNLQLDSDILNLIAPMPEEAKKMMRNVTMIRSEGNRIGELVGFKLARAIHQKLIDPQAPMHLIGHSAGGFVVLQAAIVLDELGLAPANLRISMLDTPMPESADIAKIAGKYPVDFYLTSAFAQGVPETGFVKNFARYDLKLPPDCDHYLQAHSFAHSWYIDSILNHDPRGFLKSPFASKASTSD